MRQLTLQKIVFPFGDKLPIHYGLFYRWGNRCVFTSNGEQDAMMISAGMAVDFATYLNGFPRNRWSQYTGTFNGLTLTLTIRGNCEVILTGYRLEPFQPVRRVYDSVSLNTSEPKEIKLEYPDDAGDFLTFEIHAYDTCYFYGGSYSACFDESRIRDINLSIATTTCFKEDYIRENVRLIREELLEGSEEIRDHLWLNVIDNGRSLRSEEIEADHIRLFPNNNAGGAGGFARGMIESIHMKENITHVLLMDDDVLVLPESIRRTYTMLQLLLPEWQDAFISGAMMEIDEMWTMHEDIGSITSLAEFQRTKRQFNEVFITDVMLTNKDTPHVEHAFAGWWYCCIPVRTIRENGLPLPIFIGCDDLDYSVRCKPRFISMSGICIWHMGFAAKYNAARDLYQMFRNLLIVQATDQVLQNVDIIGRWQRECERLCFAYDYDAFEVSIMAVEDFLKGPDHIRTDNGFENLSEKRKYNEELKPLDTYGNIEVRPETLNTVPSLGWRRRIYLFTHNGQRFYPQSRLKAHIAQILYDWPDQSGRIAFHKNILAINAYEQTGNMRTQDRTRYKTLWKRYQCAFKDWKSRHAEVEAAYRAAQPEFVSETFWRKYLALGESTPPHD